MEWQMTNDKCERRRMLQRVLFVLFGDSWRSMKGFILREKVSRQNKMNDDGAKLLASRDIQTFGKTESQHENDREEEG
jgi:hypothetical protein